MPSLQFRSSPSSPSPAMVHELRQRVIACLNRLADRDTLALASAELDSIARSLSPESFSLFISCLHSTDSSVRSPVRKHCVSLLSLLSRSHGDSLAPHLSKMVATILRRLHDPDSAVRAACAAAAADMSNSITASPFSLLAGPMIESLLHDRDPNAQIGAAVCLAAAVDAAAEPDVEQLKKALPKMVKLLKSEGFKAKPELLGTIGSVIGACRGGGDKAVMDWLVPCVSEFLSSEDWRARKAAAEALAGVATAEDELAPAYKKACLAVLEGRRFDKVRLVRETMNRTMEIWKRVEGDAEEVSASPTQPRLRLSTAKPTDLQSHRTLHPVSSGYPSLKSKQSNPNTPLSSVSDDLQDHDGKDDHKEASESKDNYTTPRIRRALFGKTQGIKAERCTRVVLCNEETSSSDEVRDETKREVDDLFLIRNQITQIQKQQSNMLDLLQRFMGSSQSGIQSLESRVSHLETALDVISRDLTFPRQRTQNRDHKGIVC